MSTIPGVEASAPPERPLSFSPAPNLLPAFLSCASQEAFWNDLEAQGLAAEPIGDQPSYPAAATCWVGHGAAQTSNVDRQGATEAAFYPFWRIRSLLIPGPAV